SMYETTPRQPGITVTPGYNPFHNNDPQQRTTIASRGWEKLYEAARNRDEPEMLPSLIEPDKEVHHRIFGQFDKKYIIAESGGKLMLIDQQAAHERILYERNASMMDLAPAVSQQELFPQTLTFTHDDFVILKEISEDIR